MVIDHFKLQNVHFLFLGSMDYLTESLPERVLFYRGELRLGWSVWNLDPPCDGEGLVVDPGALLGHRQLVFTEQSVALPGKDGVVTEAAEDGVALGEEEHPLHGDGLADVQLPLPLEGVQVPELGGVGRGGDGVAAGAVDRHVGHRPLVATHPAHQLPGVFVKALNGVISKSNQEFRCPPQIECQCSAC